MKHYYTSDNYYCYMEDSSNHVKDGVIGVPEQIQMQCLAKSKTLYYGAKCGGCVGMEHADCKHPIAWRENDYRCADFRRYK